MDVLQSVVAMQAQYKNAWRNMSDGYWFARLMQESGELGSSLVGDHEDLPEHELRQIASIAINWLAKRHEALVAKATADGWTVIDLNDNPQGWTIKGANWKVTSPTGEAHSYWTEESAWDAVAKHYQAWAVAPEIGA
jgi:hypothetical protein